MSHWKCIKTLVMEDDNEVAFTEGKVYYGHPSATSQGEWAMAFTNDMGDDDHLIRSTALHEYFVKVHVLGESVGTEQENPDYREVQND